MVRKALSERYREEREKRARLGLLMRISYRVGYVLWIVGTIVFFIIIYMKYH